MEDIKIRSCHGNWHAEDKYVDKKLQTDTKKRRNKLDCELGIQSYSYTS